jgi:hypothetical protein
MLERSFSLGVRNTNGAFAVSAPEKKCESEVLPRLGMTPLLEMNYEHTSVNYLENFLEYQDDLPLARKGN